LLGHADFIGVGKECACGNFLGPRESLYVGSVRELKRPEEQSCGLERRVVWHVETDLLR
jgi:hypothetical protein